MIHYVALGDSITYGLNATSSKCAYPSLLIDKLKCLRINATGTNYAHPGWTSISLLNVITEHMYSIKQASVISILIGGDDLIKASLAELKHGDRNIIIQALRTFQADLTLIIEMLKKHTSAKIIICTQYNPFPNSNTAVYEVGLLNQIIVKVASLKNIRLAPIHALFAGNQAGLIDNYHGGTIKSALQNPAPIHPNNRGHQVIASGLMPLILS